MSAFPFIPPAEPGEQSVPPRDKGWGHEVCFHGSRLQLQKSGKRVLIYSSTGRDVTARFRKLAEAAATMMPGQSCVIDCIARKDNRVAWCFDIMEMDGRDMRTLPLVLRRSAVGSLLKKADSEILLFSESFSDPERLLAAVDELGFTGIVSKRGDQPYISGVNPGWIKVECHAWREANR